MYTTSKYIMYPRKAAAHEHLEYRNIYFVFLCRYTDKYAEDSSRE